MEKEIDIYFEMRSAYLMRPYFNPLDLSMGLLSTQYSALSTPESALLTRNGLNPSYPLTELFCPTPNLQVQTSLQQFHLLAE
ncbi:hypothetical protein [Nostoc sp. WHI]|uniref:hypothetical protein n=1 Tax=Nostoc sp. WHI TaxID=2650611 RepID=UPI0018C51501|nr:hypothetical protein [Nostoc sp. WHI]MBG1268446.1 hypothetical protein [Nostoc sp. WHI]